jgi:uncharacterized protein YecE (DUF72 family)
MGRIRVGLSGWNYDSWRGDFYPRALPKARWLGHVGEQFDTVEVNGTFYGLLTPPTFRRWYREVPPGFVFAVKGSRYITHQKKLAGVETALANFFASGPLELDDKLGPVLWQLPHQQRFDAERIDRFLGLLPVDTGAAAALARRHDGRIEDPAYGSGTNHRMRHVLEVRHESFLCDEMVTIARRHGVALAFSQAADWPYTEEITAGFVYVRLHGPGEVYASPYGRDALRRWSRRVERWRAANQPGDAVRIGTRRPPRRAGRDVYVYFDNDVGGHAPREAAVLRDLVRGRRPAR